VPQFLDNLIAFGRVLRGAGIDVHTGRMVDLVNALPHVNVAVRDEVYHTCRALLVHGPEQIPAFDRAFETFWRAQTPASIVRNRRDVGQPVLQGTETLVGDTPAAADAEVDVDATPVDVAVKTWSDRGGVANKDFADCSPAEQARIAAALSTLRWTPGLRRTHRWVAGNGSRIDLRRAVAGSRRTGGDVAALPRRRRRLKPRPLVVLCDVSGSMERYSRMLLLFAHALVRRRPRVEAFLFSTHLTRVTRQMRQRRPDAALAAMSRDVTDWSGGTRIGAALHTFNQRWARRVLNGGPVVLLISDGWDRGDPQQLAREIARLQRSCRRLVWLNPLLGTADYAPLTKGLQAALPHVDDFLPARTLANFADLASHLNALAPGGRIPTVIAPGGRGPRSNHYPAWRVP
jgi:uncharacterized protein with von Willebrand factor type A (vWA) domain